MKKSEKLNPKEKLALLIPGGVTNYDGKSEDDKENEIVETFDE